METKQTNKKKQQMDSSQRSRLVKSPQSLLLQPLWEPTFELEVYYMLTSMWEPNLFLFLFLGRRNCSATRLLRSWYSSVIFSVLFTVRIQDKNACKVNCVIMFSRRWVTYSVLVHEWEIVGAHLDMCFYLHCASDSLRDNHNTNTTTFAPGFMVWYEMNHITHNL